MENNTNISKHTGTASDPAKDYFKYRRRLLQPGQLKVLSLGVEHKLIRCSTGWLCDEGSNTAQVYSFATVMSLNKMDLLDANFNDPRGFGCRDEARFVKTLDGADFPGGTEPRQLFVWTNQQGIELLKNIGLELLLEFGRGDAVSEIEPVELLPETGTTFH